MSRTILFGQSPRKGVLVLFDLKAKNSSVALVKEEVIICIADFYH